MPSVIYEGRPYALEPGETVLEGLLRHQVQVPNSCRAGVCQSCLLRAVGGTVPEKAQAGLKDTMKTRGYFLACSCHPEGDLEIKKAGADVQVPGTISELERLSESVMRVKVRCEHRLDHRAGQYISLLRQDGLARSYSIANLPSEDDLEFHVRRIRSGKMSGWLHEEAKLGEPVRIQGPSGDCFYVPGNPEQPILLVGTGTGLAPLYGIARDALAQGHTGPIWLFHGARDLGSLYLVNELRALAADHPTLRYRPCVLEGEPAGDVLVGPVDKLVLGQHPKLGGWRIFLCGNPQIVSSLKRRLFLAGASLRDIHADPFLPSAS